MSLPDIEAYIEQKIPGEHVTPDMLVAQPRAPRPQVEAAAADGESIGEIFKEVREARAAEDAKRGGRSGGRGERSGGRSGRSGERREGASRGSEARGPRPPRKPRAEPPATQESAAQAQPQAVPAEGEQAPRKRRRRRGGRRVEGATPQPGTVAASAPPATPASAQASLLSRIGRGLKSLVTRSPSKRH
jgi:ATP-dependent RNA helicase RhlB